MQVAGPVTPIFPLDGILQALQVVQGLFGFTEKLLEGIQFGYVTAAVTSLIHISCYITVGDLPGRHCFISSNGLMFIHLKIDDVLF